MPLAHIHWNLSEWLTIVGFPTTFLALLLAIQQAKAAKKQANKAVGAAEAARTAAERTEQRIADNQLLLMIPQMTLFRRELDLAVDRPDRQETLRLLGDWPTHASELQGILEHMDSDDHSKLIDDLRRSSKLTGKAKDTIITEKAELVAATSRARSLITETCASASKIVGTMKAFTGSADHD